MWQKFSALDIRMSNQFSHFVTMFTLHQPSQETLCVVIKQNAEDSFDYDLDADDIFNYDLD